MSKPLYDVVRVNTIIQNIRAARANPRVSRIEMVDIIGCRVGEQDGLPVIAYTRCTVDGGEVWKGPGDEYPDLFFSDQCFCTQTCGHNGGSQ